MKLITLTLIIAAIFTAACGQDEYITQNIVDNDRLVRLEAEIERLKIGIIKEIIDPCGDFPGQYDEILIRLGDDSIVAYFEGTSSTRYLTELTAGSYQTSDIQACNFIIDINGSISYPAL